MQERRLIATLQSLCERDIQFVVVGGLTAVLNGAPVHTYDIDVVYSRDPANVERLLSFLQEVDNHPLDLLTQGLSFSDLLPLSDEMAIGEGVSVRVLNLEILISVKEQLGSEKDLAVLPILRQTLRESKKKDRV
jgi:hypothetical protein